MKIKVAIELFTLYKPMRLIKLLQAQQVMT